MFSIQVVFLITHYLQMWSEVEVQLHNALFLSLSGYFGQGLYFTTNLEYAKGYGSSVLCCIALTGNTFPVIFRLGYWFSSICAPLPLASGNQFNPPRDSPICR